MRIPPDPGHARASATPATAWKGMLSTQSTASTETVRGRAAGRKALREGAVSSTSSRAGGARVGSGGVPGGGGGKLSSGGSVAVRGGTPPAMESSPTSSITTVPAS
jgi:hypothetical protein